jgi:hypothetical protein
MSDHPDLITEIDWPDFLASVPPGMVRVNIKNMFEQIPHQVGASLTVPPNPSPITGLLHSPNHQKQHRNQKGN